MEIIRKEEEPRGMTLAERVRHLEGKSTIKARTEATEEKTRQFRWPFKWRNKFRKAKGKRFDDMMLVIFLNKKNEIEPPKFMPIFDGNMLIWKNKPYEFDPRAVWRIKGLKGTPQTYLIKEIDRRPVRNKKGRFYRDRAGRIIYTDAAVSNNDLDAIRLRGDSTESDEFLIKAALKAQTSQARKQIGIGVIIFLVILVVGAVIWFLSSGNGGT